MDRVTEMAIKQYEMTLKAKAEAERHQERLEALLRDIPPSEYDTYVTVTRSMSVGLGYFAHAVR